MEVFTVDQNSPEWLQIRAGIPTASCFADVLAKGEGKTRATYMRKLAAELVTGAPLEAYTNQFMERGHAQEDDARRRYALLEDADLQLVGFIKNGQKGCSPDALIGSSGLLEVKTQRADLLIETLLKDQFPPTHVAQVQGGMWVAERAFADIVVYSPGMPLFIKRAYRDDNFISKLASAVDEFNEELAALVARVRAYMPEAA